MSKILNLIWRLPLLVLHILSGLVQECFFLLVYGKKWHDKAAGRQAIQRWMKRLCHILGLNISVYGTPSSYHNTLIVANHISWLDIIALSSIRNIIFMAKSDVKKWPVIGLMAAASGTLFIERGNKSALKQAIEAIASPLAMGRTVAIFPEGTTTDGSAVKPFFSSLFSAAVNTESYVQPVAISYCRNSQRDTIAPYTLDDTFVTHILKILQQDSTHIEINFLPKLRTQPYSRVKLANYCREKIEYSLQHTVSDEVPFTTPLAKTV